MKRKIKETAMEKEFTSDDYNARLKLKLKEFEDSGDGFGAYMLSTRLTDPKDIKKCEDIIISEGDTKLIASFAINTPTCDVHRCLKHIVINGDLDNAKLLVSTGKISTLDALEDLNEIRPKLNEDDMLSIIFS